MYYQIFRLISRSGLSGASVPSVFPPQLLTPKPQRRQLPTRYQAPFVVLLSCGKSTCKVRQLEESFHPSGSWGTSTPSHILFHVRGHSSYILLILFCPNSYVTSLEILSLTSSPTSEVAPFPFASRCLQFLAYVLVDCLRH